MIRHLAGHAAAYTFANLASRGIVLIWLIVLPSLLSADDYGALGLILTTAALVNVLVPLEISQGLSRYYPPAEPSEKRDYVRTAWTFTLLMLTAASISALLLGRPACELLLGNVRYLDVFRIAVGFFFLNTTFYFLQSQFRWEFRPRDFTVVSLIFAFVTLTGSVGLSATLANPLVGVLVGQLIGAGAGVAAGLVALRRSLMLGLVGAKLRQMLRFSLPLVPASVALFVSTYASRFILHDVLTLRDVGIFTWSSQLATIPALLMLGVQGALTPLVMKHQRDENTRRVLARTFQAVLAVELVLCLALGLFTSELIRLLGYAEYADAAPLVLVLAPAYLMLQLYVFWPGFAIAERTDLQLLVSLTSALAAIGFNYVLIGRLGVVGAALATLASSALFIGSWFALSRRLYPVPVQWLRVATACIAFGVIGVIGQEMAVSDPLVRAATKGVLVALLTAAVLLLGLVRWGMLTAAAALVTGRATRRGGSRSNKRGSKKCP